MKTVSRLAKWSTGLGIAGVLWVCAGVALGHHSWSGEFDSAQRISLEGTVKEMRFENPHSWLVIEVENEDGDVEEWRIQGGSPSVMFRNGWDRDTLPPGTEVSMEGSRSRDGSNTASSSTIEFGDGAALPMGAGAPEELDAEQ